MSVKDTWKRGVAVVGIVTTLAGARHPAVTGTAPDLTKQYAQYAARVRVPSTRREIGRALSQATSAAGAQKADSALVGRKAVRRLR